VPILRRLNADQRIQSGNRAFYTMFFQLASCVRSSRHACGSHAVPARCGGSRLSGRGSTDADSDAVPCLLPGHSERRVLVTFQDITTPRQAAAANDLRAIGGTQRKSCGGARHFSQRPTPQLNRQLLWRVSTDYITWSEQLYRISSSPGYARDARAESALESTRKTSVVCMTLSSGHEAPHRL